MSAFWLFLGIAVGVMGTLAAAALLMTRPDDHEAPPRYARRAR